MHGIKKIIKIVLTSFFAWALVANVNAFADIEKNALNATTDEARTCAVYFKILGLKYDAMPDFPEKKDEMALIKIYEMKAQSSYVKFSQKIALPDKEFADSIKKEFQRMLKISGSNYENTSELIDIYANDCETHVKNTEERYEHWKNIYKNQQIKQEKKVDTSKAAVYTDIKILDQVDLTINANSERVFASLKKHNPNSTCEVSFFKEEGSLLPTSIRFSLNENLIELYDFLKVYKKNASIYCDKYKYKFVNKSNELWPEKEISLRFNFCNNKINKIEAISYLNYGVYGDKPKILDKWVETFKIFSNKPVREKVDNSKDNGVRIRKVWSDEIYKDNFSSITYSVIQYFEKKIGLISYNVSIVDAKKYSRCYL